jgi:hypothetical protein
MRTLTISVALGLLVVAPALVPTWAQDKIDAEILLTVTQPPPQRGMLKAFTFSKEAKPAPGAELLLWLLANHECGAVAVGFTRDGKLVYAGSPERITLAPRTKQQVPPTGRKWPWEGSENIAEIDVILGGAASPDFQELSKLVDAMRDPNLKEPVRRLQPAKLRQWIDAHSQNKSSLSDYAVKPKAVEVGGILRSEEPTLNGLKVAIPANGYSVIRIKLE